MALTSATLLCAPKILADEIARLSRGHLAGSDHYPPLLTGMRGSHKGSFEVAHALAWRGEKPADYEQLDEHYDLVVVGAGMSGLAAAWYWRKRMGGDSTRRQDGALSGRRPKHGGSPGVQQELKRSTSGHRY